MSKINKGLYSSNEDGWETPKGLFNLFDNLFKFKLDAAASSENKKCEKYYSIEENGLLQNFENSTWINPPYSTVGTWVKKAWQESKRGNTVVLLIPARVETGYYFDYIWPYENGADVSIVFPDRIKFTFMGIKHGTSPFPSIAHAFNIAASNITYNQIKAHFYGLARCLDLKADVKISTLETEIKELKHKLGLL